MLPTVLGTVCQVGQDEPFLASDGILVAFNGEREGDGEGEEADRGNEK